MDEYTVKIREVNNPPCGHKFIDIWSDGRKINVSILHIDHLNEPTKGSGIIPIIVDKVKSSLEGIDIAAAKIEVEKMVFKI